MSNSQWNPLFVKNGSSSSVGGFSGFNPMSSPFPSTAAAASSSSSTNGFGGFGQYSSNRPTSTADNFFQQPRTPTNTIGHFMAGGGAQGPPSPPPIGHFHIGTFNPNSAFGEEPSPRAPPTNTFAHGRRDFGASSPSNYNPRETGIIEKLLHSYGFIQCCERQARLFFHFSQFDGNVEHLKIGDPVEFEVTYDRRNGKPIASMVSKIAPEVVLSEERVTGTVTNELVAGSGQQGRISYENRGECFFLPFSKDDVEGNVTLRLGDKVSFQIATSHSGSLGARYIRLENPAMPVRYQGVVCSLKESFGFIERADVVREIFFHFSEAKGIAETLTVGDDVEFTIQTKNGKEVACNITVLPPGTVVFEDVNPETLRGQVLKPLERGAAANLNAEPLSGRLRYRGHDRSEVEIPFGDKDQKGEYTLRHGDWVQFNIAVDRRDKLQRATNIDLLDESFEVSGEKRETGIVATIKDGYGFIRCAERDARVFFHFSEIVNPQETIDINSEVEFTITQDQSQPSKQSAIRIKILPTGSVQFEVIIQRNMVGTVTREPPTSWTQRSPSKFNGEKAAEENGVVSVLNNGIMEHVPFTAKECDIRNSPRLGDEVEFDLAQCKRNKELIALNIRVVQKAAAHARNGKASVEKEETGLNGESESVVQKGYIAALKDSFGFIETCTHDKEIFFHYSNFDGNPEDLDLGQEVQYSVTTKNQPGGKTSAENVKIIPKGSIPAGTVEDQILDGVVVRPMRSVNPDQSSYAGLVKLGSDVDGEDTTFEFGITSLVNKKEFLQRGDPVQFQVELCGDRRRATLIRCARRKLRSTVDAIKGQFGFLNMEVEDGKKLFFHLSEVKDNAPLQPGDNVEFVVITNQRTGKSSACHVTKIESQRPDWLVSRMRTFSVDEQNGPRLTVLRQPKGPDGTRGFKAATVNGNAAEGSA